jgi:hypothetical protein
MSRRRNPHRGARRKDRNQADLVRQLRQIPGAAVIVWDEAGDLILGYRGRNYLLEVKAPGGRPTDSQKTLLADWPGQFDLVYSLDDVLAIIRAPESIQTRAST